MGVEMVDAPSGAHRPFYYEPQPPENGFYYDRNSIARKSEHCPAHIWLQLRAGNMLCGWRVVCRTRMHHSWPAPCTPALKEQKQESIRSKGTHLELENADAAHLTHPPHARHQNAKRWTADHALPQTLQALCCRATVRSGNL
eukprot:1148698-Pelagomonas_calceolata.AAC.1